MEYFLQTNIICLILLIGVDALIRKKNGLTPVRRNAFSRLIRFTMVICISDTCAWTLIGKEFQGAREILWIANIIYYVSITLVCYTWLTYVDASILSMSYRYNRNKWLTILPLLAIIVIAVSTPATNILFSLDEHNVYARSSGVILHWIVSWGYLLFATAVIIIRIHKCKTRVERHHMYPMLTFAIMPALAAVVQMLFYGVTATQCGITISILMISYETLQDQISKDALTGLNNRAAFDSYIGEQLQRQNRLFSIFMCDINKFKSINDGYGHVVGDYVLKCVANALKSACGQVDLPVFLCRFGGDEFLFCSVDTKIERLEQLKQLIVNEVNQIDMNDMISMPLSISVGFASSVCNNETDMEKLIKIADASMYENKRR